MRRFIALTLVLAAALPAAAHAQPFDEAARGDRGSGVRLVQRALRELGYRTSVDGVFGKVTARHVKRYERRQRIAVDGAVSRGQLRGMLRRADMDTAALDRLPGDGASSSGAPARAVAPGTPTFPVQGPFTRGDGFAERGGAHQGVDLLAACGTPLVAAQAGTVVFTGSHGSAGNYVVVRSAATGEDHVSMHLLSAPETSKGDPVAAGQRLGAVGRTGNASACHLHFEIWTAPGWYEGGAARDPAPDLQAWNAGS